MSLSRKIADYKTNTPKTGGRGKKHKEWLHKIDLTEFLETLDVSNITQASADELLFSCPFPGHSSGDSKPSAYMNDGSKDKSKATVWMCHGCGRSGNAISFYAEHNEISKQEAAAHLRATYAPDFRAPVGGIQAEFEKRLEERDREVDEYEFPTITKKRYSDLFGVDWPAAKKLVDSGDASVASAYLFERGFTAKTLAKWNIGYDAWSERLTIPVCTPDGKIVGVKGRSWKSKKEQKVKYMILGDKPDRTTRHKYGWLHYEKSRVVFGLNHVVGPQNTLVLVEGELDAIALSQIGVQSIATGSAHMSDYQARLIREWCDEVVVFYDIADSADEDEAGFRATWGWFDKDDIFHNGVVQNLEPFIHVRVVADHPDDASKMIQEGRDADVLKLIDTAKSSVRLLR